MKLNYKSLDDLPPLLSPAEVRELAGGIHASTHWRKIKAGLLPGPNAVGKFATRDVIKALGLA